ncbi:MAG: hypothetical protein HND57_11005 [Planctomycetes bacterium]|nr:hypothetical protein [Planctomycetota bacterium]
MIHSNAQLHLAHLLTATHLTLMAAIILPALPALGDDYAIIPIERDNEWSSAIAINNLSQTGGAMQGTFYGEPFLWDRGKYTLLGSMGPTGAGVFDVADSGFATGYYKDQMWLETPFAWEPRQREVHILPFIDGYDSAEAYGVNSAGIVAGTAGNAVAVVWTDGVPDTLPGIAVGERGRGTSMKPVGSSAGRLMMGCDINRLCGEAMVLNGLGRLAEMVRHTQSVTLAR